MCLCHARCPAVGVGKCSRVSVTAFLQGSQLCVCACVFRVCVCVLSSVRLLTPQTVAHVAPLSMRLPRQEYGSGLPFPSAGDLPDPGIEPTSPALQMDSLALSHQVSPPSSTGTHSRILIRCWNMKITEIGKEKTNFRNRKIAVDYVRKSLTFVGVPPLFVFVNKLGDRILGQETGSRRLPRAASHSCLGDRETTWFIARVCLSSAERGSDETRWANS